MDGDATRLFHRLLNKEVPSGGLVQLASDDDIAYCSSTTMDECQDQESQQQQQQQQQQQSCTGSSILLSAVAEEPSYCSQDNEEGSDNEDESNGTLVDEATRRPDNSSESCAQSFPVDFSQQDPRALELLDARIRSKLRASRRNSNAANDSTTAGQTNCSNVGGVRMYDLSEGNASIESAGSTTTTEKQVVAGTGTGTAAPATASTDTDKQITLTNIASKTSHGQQQLRNQQQQQQQQQRQQLRQQQLEDSESNPSSSSQKRRTFGDVVTADVSHLAVDCRDLATFKEFERPGLLTLALCRWRLRRIFRADWQRDCFLCDRPLGHSCLMCFCALHAEPELELAARSYNAVVCGVVDTCCGHMYHSHCWTRWESELSPWCPKCGTPSVQSIKETFILEKRCS